MNKYQFRMVAMQGMAKTKEIMKEVINRYSSDDKCVADIMKVFVNETGQLLIDNIMQELYGDTSRKFESTDREGAIIPARSTKNSACYDFVSPINTTVPAHGVCTIPTGIKAKFPANEALMIYSRSGMGFKNSITLVNGTAVIDSDYYGNTTNDGEIIIGLRNDSDTDYHICKGDKIAQGMFVEFNLVDHDETFNERIGGLGSTGN